MCISTRFFFWKFTTKKLLNERNLLQKWYQLAPVTWTSWSTHFLSKYLKENIFFWVWVKRLVHQSFCSVFAYTCQIGKSVSELMASIWKKNRVSCVTNEFVRLLSSFGQKCPAEVQKSQLVGWILKTFEADWIVWGCVAGWGGWAWIKRSICWMWDLVCYLRMCDGISRPLFFRIERKI